MEGSAKWPSCRLQGQTTKCVNTKTKQFSLGPYDAVVTNQAVHELRHKGHAPGLHVAVKGILRPGGTYLVSDHFLGAGGLPNDQLYMTVAEHREALLNAGFSEVQQVATAGSLVMHRVQPGT